MRAILLAGAAGLALSLPQAPAFAQERLDLSDPQDIITANRKIQCSAEDGDPAFYAWYGKVYSRIPGEKDRHLFNIHGMNVRQCVTVSDETRGDGYRMVSREIMLYTDPETDDVLESWDNPFTGETNTVIHVANDPVNSFAPSFPYDAEGEPQARWTARTVEGTVFSNAQVPLWYTNPLAGDYQLAVGGVYHAMEMFNFWTDEGELLDPDVAKTTSTKVGWGRVSDWLPFMEMAGKTGIMIFHAAGSKVSGPEAMSEVLQDALSGDYALYSAPPPLDDDRPNETSWTYFLKQVDGPLNPGHRRAGD